MSLVATKALGEVDIQTGECYHFANGLYGFADMTEFAVVRESAAASNSPFLWLQSTQQVNLAFVIIEPHLFYKDTYIPQVAAPDLEALGVTSINECQMYVIVTIPNDHPEEMTANLQGPVLLNRQTHQGRQVVSLDDKHDVRIPILSTQ